MDKELEKYYEAYYENERDANAQMSFALLFTSGLIILVWFGYLFKLFTVTRATYLITCITLPIVAVMLAVPFLLTKHNRNSKPRFKYFVLLLYVLAMGVLNVIMPKHAILGWAVCIVMTNHYYNPKVGRIIFITTIVMMLICLGLGMFFGEFDSNLMSGQLDQENMTIYNHLLTDIYSDSPAGRYQYLRDLVIAGENRFTKIFFNYYLGRALLITLLFFISNGLNKRTYNLLVKEIRVSSDNQKNKTELEVAKEIQLNTLPNELISYDDIEIISELKAAREVGGDFYDYLNIDENRVAIIIGDVSGKGVPAAMFMMKTITSFRDFATKDKTPSQILKEVNASIYKGNSSMMFVTCFLAILDRRDGKLVFANAGHNPPIIGSNRKYQYLKCKTGFILGSLQDAFVNDEEFYLKPGESITLYTDGVTEARDINGGLFGEERLLDTFNAQNYTCTLELHHSVKDQVAGFVKDAPQSDDITILTLKYRGDRYSYVEKDFDGKLENIEEMLNFIKEFANQHGIASSFANKLCIVGDEIFSNIIKYGYNNSGGEIFVRLLYNEDEQELAITIIDRGPEFNPLAVDNPNISENVEERKEGGLGIFIVKNLMTDYAYDRINGKNILVLKKKF